MQSGIVRQREDRFAQLQEEFERELTPQERKWLTLADKVMATAQVPPRSTTRNAVGGPSVSPVIRAAR